MVSGSPCCPRVDRVARTGTPVLSPFILKIFFQNKLPPVSETWFEPGKILSTTTIYTRRNIASCFESCLVLQQGFPATSAEAEVAVVNISAGFS